MHSIFTSQGDRTFIPSTLLDAFKAGLRGAMLCNGDPGYDEARRIHNGMIDRQPALIVRCADAAKFPRLASIEAKYDPNNLFRLNQNVPPVFE